MLAASMDILDRTPSAPRGWPGSHAPRQEALRPDDDLGPPGGEAVGSDPAGAEHAAPPLRRGPPRQQAPAVGGGAKDTRRTLPLARLIEVEVVPRLVLAGRAAAGAPVPGQSAAAPGPEDVVALVGLSIGADAAAPLAYVEALRLRGVSLERLYLDLFAVVARRLGELWTEDLCSFADVTVGLARLQGLVREYSPAFMPSVEAHDPRRSALLIPVPGEHHTFGLAMVAEFFLRAGWEVRCEPLASDEHVRSAVRDRWFAVAGISVGNNDRLETVAALVRLVRRESRNRGIGVMVGGRVFSEKPELAGLVGADATATDGRQAALQAETLLALLNLRG